ncbi:MAG: beta-eliminating lyase-related protein, partial [Pseudomonadota bacterium]
IWPAARLAEVAEVAKTAGLAVHLDGARVLNASVATGIDPKTYASGHDSAWLAFTKGLGCPVGAVLAGSAAFIADAWLLKRRWGGAMRQTGVLAAMCLYALDHNVARLADDHALARRLAEGLLETGLVASIAPVETNIVLAELAPGAPDARPLLERLKPDGVRFTVVGPRRIRLVAHMDVDQSSVDALLAAIRRL